MSKVESADIILKLYDLRREEKMRQAREWIFTFNPQSADDYWATMMDPQVGGYLRMVTSYWEMAASFVNHTAIDEAMFAEANGEHIVCFAKVEPYLAEYRTKMGMPTFLSSLEKLLVKTPGMKERLASTRERFRALAAAR